VLVIEFIEDNSKLSRSGRMAIHLIRQIPRILTVIGLLVSVGCATVYQETAARLWQDRSGEDQKIDFKIQSGILNRLSEKDKGLLLDVSVDSWEKRVMVTGTLDDQNVRKEIIQLVRQDDRIRDIYDHIQLVSKEEKEARRNKKREREKSKDEDKSGVGQTVDDFWIETKIKAQLITGQNITSVNYFYRSVKNQVYVIGKAKSQLENDRVLQIIKETKGVESITQHIEVVNGAGY
jgi:osmotically-inducible protein OsmY